MNALVQVLRERRNALQSELETMARQVESRPTRSFTAAENLRIDAGVAEIRRLDERITELEQADAAEARAAQVRVQNGEAGQRRTGGWTVRSESAVYREDDPGVSFFRDLVGCRRGDYDAVQRLHRNNAERGLETRALGNSGGTGGSFGEFAPPSWLESEFVALARAGRITVDRLNRQPLPSGISSVNIPKIATGTTAAVQSTQNTALSSTDPTSTYLSSGITTIAGKNVISQQLLDQSGVPLDRVILGDLAADYARSLDLQVLTGSGTAGQLLGLLTVAGTTQVAYTQATPSVTGAGGFYGVVNKAVSAVSTSRFLPPDCIIMHPRRWSWIAAAFDSSGRPLVTPSGSGYNVVADAGTVAAQGVVGGMVGLPVYVDPNISTNLGAGTNQDPVLVMRASDIMLWESDVTMASFDAAYADSLGVLFRVHGYSAMIASRYPQSIAVINGTGLVAPSY